MPYYRRGARSQVVSQIQEKLKGLKLYPGPADGIFGGYTESAVRAFQNREGLDVDGVVGPETWKRLFPLQTEIPVPRKAAESLEHRCLALTGSFETSQPPPDCFAGLNGDFDGQGISFGALQWNFGQGTLQPLLKEMAAQYPNVLQEIFGAHHAEFQAVLRSGREDQLDWVRAIQDPRFRLDEPWRELFKALGRRSEYQAIQVKYAREIYRTALAWCGEYGVKTERAVALMYDIRVQNGSIGAAVKSQILRDFGRLTQAEEVERLVIIANRRAAAARKQYVEDVRTRKLTIARGEGQVHGRHYHLETQYGIGLTPAA